jgi:hypothetical protein
VAPERSLDEPPADDGAEAGLDVAQDGADPVEQAPRQGGPATVDLHEPIESLATPTTRDLEPGRDKVRAALALGLLALMTVVIGLGFALLWHAPAGLAETDGDLKSRTLFIQALLTPVASLFGAATGFYFGAGVRQQGSS